MQQLEVGTMASSEGTLQRQSDDKCIPVYLDFWRRLVLRELRQDINLKLSSRVTGENISHLALNVVHGIFQLVQHVSESRTKRIRRRHYCGRSRRVQSGGVSYAPCSELVIP